MMEKLADMGARNINDKYLKDRGESAQGSKKDLVTRLLKVRFFVLRFTMNQILNAVLNIHVDTEYYVFMIYD